MYRERFRALAPAVLLHLDPPENVVRARLDARSADPARVSDAGEGVRRLKLVAFEPPQHVDLRYDGVAPVDTLLDALTDRLCYL